MRCGLCGFLIIKPQTTLHHAMWCDAVRCTVRLCYFAGDFGGLSGLVNTPSYNTDKVVKKIQRIFTNKN